ncbi:MAG: hypothetical protein A3C84_01055 [Candidatus Ryanbacteria bacterium RIFCSPHIGHO2_02_FULL_48_12]|uniref:Uncharacterized protein n=1 Tax=Candidatus Ryanbacteria bacterium RIFCSPHIGHO2_01_FULL_48_27 TaxID=1802115 RepID=A0A1G2G4C1_9BACT|nr:MAG: hypothetical protein A2756_03565 [Candidatus Ryanbacteria bacterium RIFCSPHIGHO2_01_FULL_48_27]OGZ50706.1 MAG: hypothetical protein A3C84_01055 [Candidatus Ryanbacteria bacterium RIFCSPHIGHO2_02_FULL_48_12]
MAESSEEQITAFLQTFLDFVYAAVFAFIVQQTYEKVIFAARPEVALILPSLPAIGTLTYEQKLTRLLLAGGIFYFLMGDYLQARLLISRNPFKSYQRFFTSLIIALLDFGAASEVIRANIIFLWYVVFILLLGSLWARSALLEYPDSLDTRELWVIRTFQPITAVGTILSVGAWTYFVGNIISLGGALFLVALGWLYELAYDVFAQSRPGIKGGPGTPFLRRARISRIRRFLGFL